jgi:hypothetical protein
MIYLVAFPVLRRIRSLEASHQGEECYIFGDGASIKLYDLSVFGDRTGIAVGVMPHHRDFTRTDTRYWILPEPMFFWPALRRGPYTSRRTRTRFQTFFKPDKVLRGRVKCFLNVTNFPVGRSRSTFYFFENFPSRRPEVFRDAHVNYFAGSVNASLTLAMYLGFRRAYLVGFDYTHNPPCAGHWYELGSGIPQTFDDYNKAFFEWATQHIEVVTVVPTPQQTSLPSLDYEALTGKKLEYKENRDLLIERDLKDLAVWPDYRIFDDN